MERSKAKEAGRKKTIREKANALKDKAPRKAPTKEAIKQAGRYHAIETAKKQLNEAKQTVVPDQDQQPYNAVDKVEDYAGSIALDVVQLPVPTLERSRREAKKNAFHRETQKASASSLKKPSAKYLMRREAVKEYKRKNQAEKRNSFHHETQFEPDEAEKSAERTKEQMRRSYVRKVREQTDYNTRYPHAPNSITDPEYSIDVGVHTLADVLNMAGVESPIDLDHISLALQGYNFGPGYISWALANYGGYSELNAIEFSDMMAAQYGWAGYGDKAYVSHVLRYYPVGRLFMGEGNAAMVAVAQSQIGNVGGAPYWSWWGLDYRVEWCAIFVSWCADQCGYLDAGVLPKMEGVRPYVDWFIERGQWQDRDYEPSPGDIIFFDWESDGLADHVGIVEKVEDGQIYTVEGNSGDLCVEKHYHLGSVPVCGFGLPLY